MMEYTLILALVFLGVSTLFSMLGMGGGILYVPILLFAGYGMAQTPGISLILIAATSLAAIVHFWKNQKVDWKLALVIDPPTNIMAFVGGYFSALVPEPILRGILVVVLIVAGYLMLKNNELRPHVQKKQWWLWWRKSQEACCWGASPVFRCLAQPHRCSGAGDGTGCPEGGSPPSLFTAHLWPRAGGSAFGTDQRRRHSGSRHPGLP